MLDGGSLDANIKRVAARHAKDTGAVARKKDRGIDMNARFEGKERGSKDRLAHAVDGRVGGGVSGIYRDGKGGIYWDEDEVWELEGLLKEEDNASSPTEAKRPPVKKSGFLRSSSKQNTTRDQHNPDWVTLDHNRQGPQAIPAVRRESVISSTSSGSRDSDLDLGYTVRPRDAYGDAPAVEAHLRRRADALDAFALSGADNHDKHTHAASTAPRARPRPRQRPAPLALALEEVPPHVVPPSQNPAQQSSRHHSSRSHRHREHSSRHARAGPPLPSASSAPGSALASEGKKDFFASSFAPAPVAMPAPAPSTNKAASSPFGSFSPPDTATPQNQGPRRGSLTQLVGALALGKAGRRASMTPVSPSAAYHVPYAHHGHGSSVASASTTSLKSGKSKGGNLMGLFKR
jgi:hypothetical protein